MASKDFRTTPRQASTSFYVFDDLLFSQKRTDGGNVFRYDTVGEALEAFQGIRAEHDGWRPSLGCNIGGAREIDLVQCRGSGDNCLITDYQKLSGFKDSPDVLGAIETALLELKVDWQVDHELTGRSVLVPHEFEVGPYERRLPSLRLMPEDPEDVLTSIKEVSVKGLGWVSFREFCELVASPGKERGEAPKVTGFNVAYEARNPDNGSTGYIGVSPADFRMMKKEFLEIVRRQDLEREADVPGIKTIDGWRAFASQSKAHDFQEYALVGDAVSREVVDFFMKLAPGSSAEKNYVQVRSPRDYIDESGVLRPVFTTFIKTDGIWRYGGECPCGEKPEFARPAYKGSWREMIAEAKEMAKAVNSEERPGCRRHTAAELDW